MRGTIDTPPILLRRSLKPLKLIAAGAVIMIAVVFFGVVGTSRQREDAGQFGAGGGIQLATSAAFFTAAVLSPVIIFFLIFHMSSELEVDREGFTQTIFWRQRRFAWKYASNFRLNIGERGGDFVKFDYRGGLGDEQTGADSRDCSLWPSWEIDAPSLKRVLIQASERWSAQSTGDR